MNKAFKLGYLIILIHSLCFLQADAQKFLLLEKRGSAKAMRFYIGDIIEFQTTQFPDVWIKRTIYDINTERQLIDVGDGIIAISSIYKLRLPNQSRWRSLAFAVVYSSWLSTVIGTAWAWVFHATPPDLIAISIITIPILVVPYIQKKTQFKTRKIGIKYRLKGVDTTFYNDQIEFP